MMIDHYLCDDKHHKCDDNHYKYDDYPYICDDLQHICEDPQHICEDLQHICVYRIQGVTSERLRLGWGGVVMGVVCEGKRRCYFV